MVPYYKYKKERLEKKFSVAVDTIVMLQGAMKEYNTTNSIYLKRSILGYFQDFTSNPLTVFVQNGRERQYRLFVHK